MRIQKLLAFLAVISVAMMFFVQCNRQKPRSNSEATSHPDTAALFFQFFLSEKTMIVNQEQDNEIEGHYLKALQIIADSVIQINLPPEFYLRHGNYSHWMLGWSTGKPYYDAGNENLAEITSIDTIANRITTGKILRGGGYPKVNQRLVFWNRNPAGFKNSEFGKIINPKWWKSFAGESIEFGGIVFDSIHEQWVMYLQEVDTNHVNIYAATSGDFIRWNSYNNGNALFQAKDFLGAEWAGLAADGRTSQTARMYSVIFDKGKYFFFLSGYPPNGKRCIGLITANDPLNGPFTIYPKPLVSPDSAGFDVNGCFYPKVCRGKNKFLMYYDGVGSDGTEKLCLAESKDLMHWKKYPDNPVIDKHYGWRSGRFTSEPNYVECKGDSVYVMLGGYKKYNTEFTLADSIQKRLPMDSSIFSPSESEKGRHISGNVMDAASGVFLSTDGGYTFRPHINNPVWINDYSDSLQDDHLGGDFFHVINNRMNGILYQAKSETQKRYNILLRRK